LNADIVALETTTFELSVTPSAELVIGTLNVAPTLTFGSALDGSA
jgi:hypothetical protein